MKNKLVWLILGIAVIFLIIFFVQRDEEVIENPTLSVEADKPDTYLKTVANHAFNHEFDKCIYHLEKAIESIQTIESDVDQESAELLEGAISRLESVKQEFVKDSLITTDMNAAFEYSLNVLARAELRVSEMYAETNQREFAELALKHARLHVKNAQWQGDAKYEDKEHYVFLEIDSLIQDESISPVDLTIRIDKILKEMDQLIADSKE